MNRFEQAMCGNDLSGRAWHGLHPLGQMHHLYRSQPGIGTQLSCFATISLTNRDAIIIEKSTVVSPVVLLLHSFSPLLACKSHIKESAPHPHSRLGRPPQNMVRDLLHEREVSRDLNSAFVPPSVALGVRPSSPVCKT